MEYPQLRDSLSGYWPRGQMSGSWVIGLTLSEAYQGVRRTIEHNGLRLRVTIPAGVHTGAKVYLPHRDRGSATVAEYGTIVVHDQPPFKRCGDDLLLDYTIDAFTAIVGGRVMVPTLFSQTLLTVPPGTGPGTTLRLASFGMPVLGHPQEHGDLCVHLRVQVRATATALERKLIVDNAWLRGWRLNSPRPHDV
jgi:curved DNA-binding protein